MWFTEGFVNETQARSDIITTFITISIVFLGMIIAFLLLWAYNKSDRLFFMVFAGMVALYACTMVIFIAIIRSNITSTQFKIFMITGTFMAILSIIILIIFVVKTTYLFKSIDVSKTRSPERESPRRPRQEVESFPEPIRRVSDEEPDNFPSQQSF